MNGKDKDGVQYRRGLLSGKIPFFGDFWVRSEVRFSQQHAAIPGNYWSFMAAFSIKKPSANHIPFTESILSSRRLWHIVWARVVMSGGIEIIHIALHYFGPQCFDF
jgi:hypothetical protein